MDSNGFIPVIDRTLGLVLAACCASGVLGNLCSLSYFTTNVKNANAKYFKRIYTVISLVDLLMSFTLFPVIEAAFTSGRLGSLFVNNTGFCFGWDICHQTIHEMSVFLVAMISLSRLVLLMRPTVRLRPGLGYIIPASYFVMCSVIKAASFGMGVFSIGFVSQLMSCVPIAMNGSLTDWGEPLVHLDNEVLMVWAQTIQFGMTALPISASCFLSLWYLRRSMKATKGAKGSTVRQVDAAKTVIIVTLIYVICNVPIFLYFLYFWIWNLSLDRSKAMMTISEFNASYLQYFSTIFMKNYSSILVARVFPALNSALNPLIYVWRMRPFKKFIYYVVGNSKAAKSITLKY